MLNNNMRKIIKKIWKIIMYKITKFYIGKEVFLVNEIQNIPKFEKSFSQFGQDSYIFNKLFKNKNHGTFADVGGNYPIDGNNTYLFEINGWQGIAMEPQDKLRFLWKDLRKTKCLDCVIGPEEKEIVFIEAGDSEHGLSGVKDFNKVSSTNLTKTETIKIQKRLDKILIENNLENLDYLSIDVEGYEMEVLKSIDFNKINIEIICLENNSSFNYVPLVGEKIGSELGSNIIREFLKSKNYKHIARIMCDDIFIKK